MKTFNWRQIKAEDLQFAPEIDSDFACSRRAVGRICVEGYTRGELDSAQEKLGLKFPPCSCA